MTEAQFQKMQGRLLKLLDQSQDRLRFYRFCGKDQRAVEVDGRGSISQDWDYHIV